MSKTLIYRCFLRAVINQRIKMLVLIYINALFT